MFINKNQYEELKNENLELKNKIYRLKHSYKDKERMVKLYEDNMQYIMEKCNKTIGSDLLESLFNAMKIGINLRDNEFLVSIEDIDEYFLN